MDSQQAARLSSTLIIRRQMARDEAFRDVIISADTFYAEVAREAIAAGANMVNDVSGGLLDPDILPEVGYSLSAFDPGARITKGEVQVRVRFRVRVRIRPRVCTAKPKGAAFADHALWMPTPARRVRRGQCWSLHSR